MIIPLLGYHVSDLLLLLLYFGHATLVAPLEVTALQLDGVTRRRPHFVKSRAVHFFRLLAPQLMRLHHLHLLLFDLMHIFNEVLSALQIFDPLVSPLLFLEQLYYA